MFINVSKLDIILASETHFTSHTYFKIKGYMIYTISHLSCNAQGGRATIIKNSFNHRELQEYKTEHMQATTTVEMIDWCGPITVSAVYCPHHVSNDMFNDYFLRLGNQFIVDGDECQTSPM